MKYYLSQQMMDTLKRRKESLFSGCNRILCKTAVCALGPYENGEESDDEDKKLIDDEDKMLFDDKREKTVCRDDEEPAESSSLMKRWNYEATTHGDVLHIVQGYTIRHDRNFVIDHRLQPINADSNLRGTVNVDSNFQGTVNADSKLRGTVNADSKLRGTVNREGVRHLTPRECARLQGFPDDFVLPTKDAVAYKLIEQSSPIPVIESMMKSILPYIIRYGKRSIRDYRNSSVND